jgi:hypothetical protein
MKLTILRDRMQMILEGQRKRHLCDWWLTYIEFECDKFLTEHNYNKHCIPDDYMNIPPADLDVVNENLKLIQSLMDMTSKQSLEFDELIDRVTSEIYIVLDEFISDTEYLLTTKKIDVNVVEYTKQKESLKKDVDYLLQMKSMDEEIRRRRKNGEAESSKLEMTDVVPIGGLVMARLHVIECELKTALELWTPKNKSQPPPKPPRNNSHSKKNRQSMIFRAFTETDLKLSPNNKSCEKFTEYVFSTCPLFTTECCVDVVLTRRSMLESRYKFSDLLSHNSDQTELTTSDGPS